MSLGEASGRRRAIKVRPGAECLEGRSLLTAGAGSLFALAPGVISQPAETVDLPFTLDPAVVQGPRRSIILGIDVATAKDSTVRPQVRTVEPVTEAPPPGTPAPRTNAAATVKLARNSSSDAVLVQIQLPGGPGVDARKPVTLATKVGGKDAATGGFLVGYYLPGDANGDGIVNRTDLNKIRASLGARIGDAGYIFDGDSNRDGTITRDDLNVARMNQGAKTIVQPLITANLDKASDSGVEDRITVYRSVHFRGTATPGAKITYQEVDNKVPTATTVADTNGKYLLTIDLAEGKNTFQVTSVDAFGQTISGQISPVEYMKPLVPVESPPPTPDEPTEPDPKKTTPAERRQALLAQRQNARPKAAPITPRGPQGTDPSQSG